MKLLLIAIIFFVLGVVAGGYGIFKITIGYGVDEITNAFVQNTQDIIKSVDPMQSSGTNISTNTQKFINKQVEGLKQQLIQKMNNKKEEIKDEIKRQLIQYIQKQIESVFGLF